MPVPLPNNQPTTTLYSSAPPSIHRLSLLKLLSTIPAILALLFLASLRHRLRQAVLHTTIWYAHRHLPFFLLDIFIWAPLFYTVIVLQLSIFYLSPATFKRLVALRSPAQEARSQTFRAMRQRRDEQERARMDREERRQALLVGGGGGWGGRAEMRLPQVRWGKDAKGETKLAWWEQNITVAREKVEEGIRLERAGLGEAVRCFT